MNERKLRAVGYQRGEYVQSDAPEPVMLISECLIWLHPDPDYKMDE
jgi:hypothetical protein